MENNFNNANVPPTLPQKEGRSVGALTAILVGIAVVILGLFYFWGERAVDTETSELNGINVQSTSDLEADIEADLEATDVDNVDYDLDPENFNAS